MNCARCGHYPATQPKPGSAPKLAAVSGVWFEIFSLRWLRGRSGSVRGIRCANRRIPMVAVAPDRMQCDQDLANGKKWWRISRSFLQLLQWPPGLPFLRRGTAKN